MPHLTPGTRTQEQEMNLVFEGGKDNKRQRRRQEARRRIARQMKEYAARTQGAYLDDDGELDNERLIATIHKRNDREQTGRLRMAKGCCPSGEKKYRRDAILTVEDSIA